MLKSGPSSAPQITALRIVNARGVPGTLGVVVYSTGGLPCFLTNHHVLFGHGAREGDPVWVVDNDSGRKKIRELGRVVRGQIGRITYNGEPIFVDCAIGVFNTEHKVPSMDSGGVAGAILHECVVKTGAATGQTKGITADLAYSDYPFVDGKTHEASGQLLIRPCSEEPHLSFSAAGDSGAVVRRQDGRIVGLLWGSNANGEGIACPIRAVLECLNVTLNQCGRMSGSALSR